MTLLAGIAALLPAPAGDRADWLGLRFFQASMTLIVILYLGNVVFHIPLSAMTYVLGTVAFIGVIHTGWRARATPKAFLVDLFHPVWIFAALVGFLVVLRGGVDYLPFTGDEVSSWLRLARQIYLADNYWSDQIVYAHPGYTNGWPLLIAFVNQPADQWNDGNATLVPFLIHLGLCGLIFDVLRKTFAQVFGPGQFAKFRATLFAWLGLLALLAIEASWLLIPRFLLIDEPLLYAFLGIFLTAIVGIQYERARTCIAAYLGLTLAAGYLLKISMLAAVPAVGIILIEYARHEPRPLNAAVRYATLMFIPLILASISWRQAMTGAECNASPFALLGLEGGLSKDRLGYVGSLYMRAAADYLLSYKVPATIGALGCLVTGLVRPRWVWIVVAVTIFIVGYTAALYISYLSCIEIVDDQLLSFPRYFLVNLRILHVIGPIVLVLALSEIERTRTWIRRIVARDWVRAGVLVALAVLFILQIWQVERSLADLATRQNQDAINAALVTKMKREANSLGALVKRLQLDSPRVSIVAQGGYGVEIDFGNYFGIKRNREGGSNFLYTVLPPYSWGARATSFTAEISSKAELIAWWRSFDIVWPVQLDDFVRGALAELIDGDDSCRDQPELYFLVKVTPEAFDCIAKVN